MCQAYEGERAAIVSSEHWAARNGFAAALQGRPRSDNPHPAFSKYSHDAWDHGWDCFQQRLLPWAIERELRASHGGLYSSPDVREQFKSTGVLPQEILDLLR